VKARKNYIVGEECVTNVPRPESVIAHAGGAGGSEAAPADGTVIGS
jgi:hypothetical protein